jgi:hypothetical protein
MVAQAKEKARAKSSGAGRDERLRSPIAPANQFKPVNGAVPDERCAAERH